MFSPPIYKIQKFIVAYFAKMFTEFDTNGGQLQKYSIQQTIQYSVYTDTYSQIFTFPQMRCVKEKIMTIIGYYDVLFSLFFRASGRHCATYVNMEQICQIQNTFIVYICTRYMAAFIFNADVFLWSIFHGKKISKSEKKTHTTHNFLSSGSPSSSHKNEHK